MTILVHCSAVAGSLQLIRLADSCSILRSAKPNVAEPLPAAAMYWDTSCTLVFIPSYYAAYIWPASTAVVVQWSSAQSFGTSWLRTGGPLHWSKLPELARWKSYLQR